MMQQTVHAMASDNLPLIRQHNT